MTALAEGMRFKEYLLEEFIKGECKGTRAVWRASKGEKQYIIKEKSDDAEYEKERAALRRLEKHPNIAPLTEEDTATRTLITPYVGEELPRLWRRGSAPTLQEAIDYALSYITALDYMHQQGVVHLDLNLFNLLVPDEYTVHGTQASIIDMGEARLEEEFPLPPRTFSFYANLLLDIILEPEMARRAIQPRTYEGSKHKDVIDLGRSIDKIFCVTLFNYDGSLISKSAFGFGDRLRRIASPLASILRDVVTARVTTAKEFKERLGNLSVSLPFRMYAHE